MTVGNVANSVTQLLAADRVSAEARRSEVGRREQAESGAAASSATRQDFVLGAAAYRRVLATLESDRSAASSSRKDGGNGAAINQSVRYQSSISFTGQRAQLAYQDTTQGSERESLSSLIGVDVFV